MGGPRFPEPPVKYQGYSSLSLATADQVASAWKLAGFDRGVVALTPGRVVFTGMQVLVDCPNVTSVRLVRKAFPWLPALLVALAAAVLVYASSPRPYTWNKPGFVIVFAIVAVTSFLQWRELWIEVVSQDAAGLIQKVFFRDRGRFLLTGNTATRRLFAQMQREVLPHSHSAGIGSPPDDSTRALPTTASSSSDCSR